MFVIKHMIQYNHEYFFLLPSQNIPTSSNENYHPLIQTLPSSSYAPSTLTKQSLMSPIANSTNDSSLLSIKSPVSSKDDDKYASLHASASTNTQTAHRGYEYLKLILQTMRSRVIQDDKDSVVIHQRECILRYLQECTVHYLGLVKDPDDEKYDDLGFLRVVK
jgi:hypothetical protein